MIILGVDAAWSKRNASGYALLEYNSGRAKLISFARSNEEFLATNSYLKFDWSAKTKENRSSISDVLKHAENLCGQPPNIVALDIPLSPFTITARRAADDAISNDEVFKKAHATTHSPTKNNSPEPKSTEIFTDLCSQGYQWAARNYRHGQSSKVFIEVYPHPAIIRFMNLKERLRYKVSKYRKYWPEEDFSKRVQLSNLIMSLSQLRAFLIKEIDGLESYLPHPSELSGLPLARLKSYEDVLDALVCSLVGCRFVSRQAQPYGDEYSTIWVPLI